MSYQLLTRTGKSFYEVTSAMQNGIRKGDYEVSGYAMWELLPEYKGYLRKRLLVISAEDCYGVITKEIFKLCEIGDEESLTRALSLMCLCKKNRDADYFVCNLMNHNDAYNELSKSDLSKKLLSAIRGFKLRETGELCEALFRKSRKELWDTLMVLAEAFAPHLLAEFKALRESNEAMTKPTEETIFVAKAIILYWTKRSDKKDMLGYSDMSFDSPLEPEQIPVKYSLDECKKIKGLFPEWAYNWHTTYGKYTLRRDAVHAISNDQKLLTPLEVNLFDDCTWDVDLNICLQKHNPRNYPLPYSDGKISPYEKYGQ